MTVEDILTIVEYERGKALDRGQDPNELCILFSRDIFDLLKKVGESQPWRLLPVRSWPDVLVSYGIKISWSPIHEKETYNAIDSYSVSTLHPFKFSNKF